MNTNVALGLLAAIVVVIGVLLFTTNVRCLSLFGETLGCSVTSKQ